MPEKEYKEFSVPFKVEVFRKKVTVKPDGSKSYTMPMKVSVDWGLGYCKELIREGKGNLDEILQQYVQFALAQSVGLKAIPIIIDENGNEI